MALRPVKASNLRVAGASGVKAGALNSLHNALYTLKESTFGCFIGAACHLDDLLQRTCIYYKTHPQAND